MDRKTGADAPRKQREITLRKPPKCGLLRGGHGCQGCFSSSERACGAGTGTLHPIQEDFLACISHRSLAKRVRGPWIRGARSGRAEAYLNNTLRTGGGALRAQRNEVDPGLLRVAAEGV